MKGKERENSMSVYLSVLKERGQGLEKVGKADGGSGVGGGRCVLPCGTGLVCFRGKLIKRRN